MSEKKITPGPWRVRFGNIGHVKAENGALIAKCQRLTSLCNLQANAHLIAAAPELYEALEELISSISYRIDFHDRNGPHLSCQDGEFIRMDVLEDWAEGVAKARAALAKARGETP